MNSPRLDPVGIRIATAERLALESLALREGLTVSAFARRLIVTGLEMISARGNASAESRAQHA